MRAQDHTDKKMHFMVLSW